MKRLGFTLGRLILVGAACSLSVAAGDFRSLFDGRSLEGWRTLERDNGEGRWLVEDGLITPTGKPGDLATVDEFGDFELVFEWRIAALGNSGVFYRVPQGEAPVQAAVEYQLADNARKPSQEFPDRRNGAAYGLYSPLADASKPVGEWNESRVAARGTHVEHWLNGVKVGEYDTAGEDWEQRLLGTASSRTGRISAERGVERLHCRATATAAWRSGRSGCGSWSSADPSGRDRAPGKSLAAR